MKFHLCTEYPCHVQDKECVEILNNGFTTNYNTMPNKELLLTYAQNKIKISQLEAENEMLKEQCQKEVEAVVGDTDSPLALEELPGFTFSLAKAPAKWKYSENCEMMIKEVESVKKDEQADGRATNLNDGKKILKFNSPKE